MPCSECGQTLIYHQEKERLYCPSCLSLSVVESGNINKAATELQKQYFNYPELAGVLDEFGSIRVIAELVEDLNEAAAGLQLKNRMPFGQMFQTLPLLVSVYENIEGFDSHLDPSDEDAAKGVKEAIDAVQNADTVLVPIVKGIQEDFIIPIELSPVQNHWKDFYRNHAFEKSEYWLCTERCLHANVGARDELREDFLQHQQIFRSFEKTKTDDIETVRDFGDAWYSLIVGLGFAASLDDDVKTAFTTYFPDHVTIFDIQDLLYKVGDHVTESGVVLDREDYRSIPVLERDFDECGEEVFGEEYWEDVKGRVLVSKETPDAHPLFFKISGTREEKRPGWRTSRPVPYNRVLFGDYLAKLTKFQVYPFLKNGDAAKSTEILDDLTAKRGRQFERFVFKYLIETEATNDVYFSCKTSKQEGNEVDVVFTHDETVYFVECKFMLPTLNMRSQKGIQKVNKKFEEKVFKEGADVSGKSFEEKVAAWRALDTDAEILHQPSGDASEREWTSVPENWIRGDYEMLTVSNFVPSYLKKRGVRFLTDLELYRWIENGEDVFYDALH
jgi:Holliday junction resolvase-like predicted endonuclease